MINLTEKAAFRLRAFLRAKGSSDETATRRGVRLSVADGGCSGYEYKMDITSQPHSDDLVIEEDSVLFYIDLKSSPLLEGLEIDFIDGLMESGFKFSNPNASGSCGCGKSFKAGDCTPAAVPCS
ncbi:Protein HesB, heterocyst [Planktothrix tepida]|uniref:Protein HesB, heterocyst n=2 Tax=Planktothrix TaxID=54304 RepID=A0A1J1LRV8_9CYAN|nr:MULTISPECIES: iron-sulfur cluster assembly accessory protein [Planktothrix]CAD5951948.1 Protein HesB, heterocyst [Planktothrix pseudagardhii]CAD5958673.1 Protein HesB, heterocyst [Planktothrix tepida]CUR34588.1 Protein HesB, heterocyst [Planktothrix tepida PCC 9214]